MLFVGSQRPLAFRGNDILYPGRVINSVQVLFAKIRGYGDYRVSARELRSQLLIGGEDCSGASPDKQVIISNERKTGFNRLLFADDYDLIRIGEIRKLWPYARANARDVSFPGRASECD